MAYPQPLGRWRVTGFSSSVGSQFSVVSLLTSPRRNIGNDHLATAIASSQRNSFHPQAMLVVEPRNLHPMEWWPLGAEGHSLKTLSHQFLQRVFGRQNPRDYEAIVEDYICFISLHTYVRRCSSYSHSRINKTANWSISSKHGINSSHCCYFWRLTC